jgi:hypothetical protein
LFPKKNVLVWPDLPGKGIGGVHPSAERNVSVQICPTTLDRQGRFVSPAAPKTIAADDASFLPTGPTRTKNDENRLHTRTALKMQSFYGLDFPLLEIKLS